MLRGVLGYCTACGQARSPLVTTPVELAGKPSRIGGTITQAVAWSVLVLGMLAAAIVTAILVGLTSTGALGWVIGGIIAVATLAIGLPLLFGGRTLQKMGAKARRDALERAVYAFGSQRNGIILAADFARAMRVSYEEADAFLTELAKRPDEPVRVDIDDEGRVIYRLAGFEPLRVTPRYRVDGEGRVVDGELEEEAVEEEEAARRQRHYE